MLSFSKDVREISDKSIPVQAVLTIMSVVIYEPLHLKFGGRWRNNLPVIWQQW